MQIVLYVFSALLMLAGLYGLVMGWDIIMVERGWSQFIAGATAFCSGAIILALVHVAQQLKKLRGDLTGLAVEVVDEPAGPVAMAATATAPVAIQATPKPETAAPASEERSVVGSYASGGVTYFMYSDNSIEAELPNGRHRFASMEELRTYLDGGTGGTIVRQGAAES